MVGKGLQEAKHSAARTRLLGREGGWQAHSNTTSTSGIVHVKAYPLFARRRWVYVKVFKQCAVNSCCSQLQVIVSSLMSNSVAG